MEKEPLSEYENEKPRVISGYLITPPPGKIDWMVVVSACFRRRPDIPKSSDAYESPKESSTP